jgi:hypothetical protein
VTCQRKFSQFDLGNPWIGSLCDEDFGIYVEGVLFGVFFLLDTIDVKDSEVNKIARSQLLKEGSCQDAVLFHGEFWTEELGNWEEDG